MNKTEKRRQNNRLHLTAMRNAIKEFRKAVAGKVAGEQLIALYKKAVRRIQRAATKDVIHRNQMARRISRLTRSLNQALLKGGEKTVEV
ncbi:MAG: 30S ribosomal protein S20 [bacterium JZ-2024 1]